MPRLAQLTLPNDLAESVKAIIETRETGNNGEIKSHVPTGELLAEIFGTTLPRNGSSFDEFINQLQELAKRRFTEANAWLVNNGQRQIKNPTSSAFSNCNGRWAEYGYAAYAWNALVEVNNENQTNADNEPFDVFVYIKLPNRSAEENDWIMLLKNDIVTALSNYPVSHSARITNQRSPNFGRRFELISSNPDAVIVKFKSDQLALLWENANIHAIDPFAPISTLNIDVVNALDSIFASFANTVLPSENLQCFLSIKRSIRPDRRYQWVHEGDHVKTILQWIQVNAALNLDPGLHYLDLNGKFFAIALSEVTDPDISAMNTGLVGSIVSPLLDPVWAVDKVFECTHFNYIKDQILAMIHFNDY